LIILFVEHSERWWYWHTDDALLLCGLGATKVETGAQTCHEVRENRTAHGEQLNFAAVIIVAVEIMK
jgi:hypothetical protein